MSLSLYLMFLIILLCSILIIYKTIYYNKKITPMAGMMVAMALGMSIGLTIGVILGILISDNFFIATVVGMLVGMLDRKSTRLNSSHVAISYAVFCLKKKEQ